MIGILGSTGSIGRSALDFIGRHRDAFRVTVLTAGKNIALLEKQIHSFLPEIVAVADRSAAGELQKRIGKKRASSLTILSGQDGIAEAAAYKRSDVRPLGDCRGCRVNADIGGDTGRENHRTCK